MAKKNFLLKGDAQGMHRAEDSQWEAASPAPYEMKEAVERLAPQLEEAAEKLRGLPEELCPGGCGVVALKMHPDASWDSHYPAVILSTYELRHLGSASTNLQGKKISVSEGVEDCGAPEAGVSQEIYVAGKRSSFENWALDFRNSPSVEVMEAAQWIKEIAVPTAAEKLRRFEDAELVAGGRAVEFVLHTGTEAEGVLSAFKELAAQCAVQLHFERKISVAGLCYIPGIATEDQLRQLVDFPYLRLVRPVARLRSAKGQKLTRD